MSNTTYSINMEAKYQPLELVDVNALVDACKDQWYMGSPGTELEFAL